MRFAKRMSTSEFERVALDQRLRLLEAEFARATERFREAKHAAKRAKREAKHAKKDRKRARLALINAQEAYEKQGESPTAESEHSDEVRKETRHDRGVIPDSPERKRAPRRARKPKNISISLADPNEASRDLSGDAEVVTKTESESSSS
jgi:hypothetical protein